MLSYFLEDRLEGSLDIKDDFSKFQTTALTRYAPMATIAIYTIRCPSLAFSKLNIPATIITIAVIAK
jgi:hypothetical protein